MTQNEITATVWVVSGLEVEQTTYGDYLREYWADETTSPNGVAPRLHIRDREKDTDGFEVWTWGPSGNRPRSTGYAFDTEEEAEMHIYAAWETDMRETNNNNPYCYESESDALEAIAECNEKPLEVAERWYRLYLREQQRKEALKKAQMKYAEEKWARRIAARNKILNAL